MSNMDTLRQNIFDTMKGLQDGTVKVTTAKAMSEAAQVLINSLKVEIDAHKLAGNKQLPGFISSSAVLISRGDIETTSTQEHGVQDDAPLKPEELSSDQLDLLAGLEGPRNISSAPNVTVHKGKYY